MLIKTQKCHIADIQSYEQIYEQSRCKPIKFLLFITQTHTNQILNSPNIAQHISLWRSQSAEKTMKLINEARIPDIKKDNSPESQAINSIYIYDPFFEYLESLPKIEDTETVIIDALEMCNLLQRLRDLSYSWEEMLRGKTRKDK